MLRQLARAGKTINKLKESILNDVKIGGGTRNASNETISATNTGTTSANSTTITTTSDTYTYGVGILVVFAIDVCVFFAYNTFQVANKKQVNEKQDQPPKRRHML